MTELSKRSTQQTGELSDLTIVNEIQRDEFVQMLKGSVDPAKIGAITKISEQGVMNSAYFVDLLDGSRLVLRGSKNVFWSDIAYAKEKFCSNYLHARGFQVPEILDHGRIDTVIGPFSFSISTCLSGQSGLSYLNSLSGSELDVQTRKIFNEVGDFAREIKLHKVPGFGIVLADDKQGFMHKTFGDYAQERLANILSDDSLLNRGLLTAEQIKIFESYFGLLYKLDNEDCGLAHADLSPGNFLVDKNGNLCGVVDFGEAGSLHPVCEFAPIALYQGEQRLHAFSEGYGASFDLAKMEHELNALKLLRAFISLRWNTAAGPEGLSDNSKKYYRTCLEILEAGKRLF